MKTIGDIEKEYGVDFKVRSDMLLSTYLKREGLPSMARALELVTKIHKFEKYNLTVGQLRNIIADVPDDAKVYYHRIEDVYFEKHGWKAHPIPDDQYPEEVDKYIRAFTAFMYEGDLYITAHF